MFSLSFLILQVVESYVQDTQKGEIKLHSQTTLRPGINCLTLKTEKKKKKGKENVANQTMSEHELLAFS